MRLDEIVRLALDEDLAPPIGDVTTTATVPEGARALATISQKSPGVIYGLDAAEATFRALDADVELTRLAPEAQWRDPGPVLRIAGDARALLAAERTALNLLAQLSGVATLTAQHVRAVEGTGVRILDTRKTVPGMRALQKQAVLAGGGVSHRFGLFDAFLIKENHIAMVGGITAAVAAARAAHPELLLEVECETVEEVAEALAAAAPRILLDNMGPDELRAAVAVNAASERPAELECSGGVTLETIRSLAVPGLDFISVGALTHSAPALDMSLLLEAVS
ncbi:MAG TPA: carboxylating nicotinate-nucleotide diphosphorylase [Solirubrobacteraceae bacterium]|nr:carboxylating nicotinate-nucleotide diphosphorylase [Solirubrobacteraceae bacterium]